MPFSIIMIMYVTQPQGQCIELARLRFVAKAKYLWTYCDPSIPYMEASTMEDVLHAGSIKDTAPQDIRQQTAH